MELATFPTASGGRVYVGRGSVWVSIGAVDAGGNRVRIPSPLYGHNESARAIARAAGMAGAL